MRGIPAVKTYRVTLLDGSVYHVTAPTKYLARLNFIFDRPAGSYAAGGIVSVGIARKVRKTGPFPAIELESLAQEN